MVYVGTSYDVNRYFWDMYTDENVPLADLADIYVGASPHDWAAAAVYPLYWHMLPFVRLAASASVNYEDEHGRQANNGVDHGPTP